MNDPTATSKQPALPLDVVHVFRKWWSRISDESARGIDKADRAVLRRCDSINAVACTSAYQRAYRAMRDQHRGREWTEWQKDRLAMLVGLAAHVGADGKTLPDEMHRPAAGSESRPCVSELRFKRLLDSPDADSLFTGLRRVLPLVKHRANLDALAQDIFGWNDEVKKHWAYAYYDSSSVRSSAAA